MQAKSCKLLFNTCEGLFRSQLAGLYRIVDEFSIVKESFKILICIVEVVVEDFCDVVLLPGYAARLLCLLRSGGVGCVLHIGSGALEQSCVDCLLVRDSLNLY